MNVTVSLIRAKNALKMWIEIYPNGIHSYPRLPWTPCEEAFGHQKTYLKHLLRKYLED